MSVRCSGSKYIVWSCRHRFESMYDHSSLLMNQSSLLDGWAGPPCSRLMIQSSLLDGWAGPSWPQDSCASRKERQGERWLWGWILKISRFRIFDALCTLHAHVSAFFMFLRVLVRVPLPIQLDVLRLALDTNWYLNLEYAPWALSLGPL